MQVLNLLQPHPNIKEMEIHGFGGTSFPQWIGSPSLVSINRLQLSKCRTAKTLPSLGLLPSLGVLKISEMDAVCTVGPEFFGTAERPFRSLEVLEFEHMLSWESWCFSFGNKEINQHFPRLNKLKLSFCPKLVSELPHQLSSLIKLDVQFCPILEEISSTCMTSLPSLKELGVRNCSPGLLARISSAANLNALTKISLSRMNSKLQYLNKDFLSSLRVIEVFEFESCDGLICLWEDDNAEVGMSVARLRCLSVEKCENLQKLPDNMQMLTSLSELKIIDCPNLESFPEGMMSCSSLEKLIIRGCGSLICFPKGAMLPTTLRSLNIEGCEKLERLPEGIIVINNGELSSSSSNAMVISHQLEELEITDCPSLKPFINNISKKKQACRISLKRLKIKSCGNVFDWLLEGGDEDEEINIGGCNIKSITHSLDRVFTNLTELKLVNCPYLEVDVFPQLPSCLKSLSLENCNKIKSLPAHQMHQTSPSSLQTLRLEKLSIESFPKEGLPLSLEFLLIQDCEELRQPMAEWGLHKLTALKKLYIGGEIGCLQGMTFFPPSDWSVIPSNLELLGVCFQNDLVSLSNGLRNHLTSLRALDLYKSPNLQFLPNEGFPPSIEYLNFVGGNQDLRGKLSSNGQYFPLIERIPEVDLIIPQSSILMWM